MQYALRSAAAMSAKIDSRFHVVGLITNSDGLDRVCDATDPRATRWAVDFNSWYMCEAILPSLAAAQAVATWGNSLLNQGRDDFKSDLKTMLSIKS